ncbi:carbohydrate sulfotransferase 3-like [Patiria miniata]|uniref:Sulfotransferase domain-containing protein n=1 Tax=Patiria miniata TaxID=46514 RepID=A0A913ZX23_PATMI|nr:carbohydrate sulfotransferase 3-like [Patiria miniata]
MTNNQLRLLWIVLAVSVWVFLSAAMGHLGVTIAFPKSIGSWKNFTEQGSGRPSTRECSCNNSPGNTYAAIEPNSLQSTPDTKVRMFILANMRTGSSFVGDIFGSSSDVFYLFEPGLSLNEALENLEDRPRVLSGVYLRMLRRLYLCDFRQLDFYLQWLSQKDMFNLRKLAPRLHDLCSKSPAKGSCTITREMATESCQQSKYLVVKSIRIPDIMLLMPMMEDEAIKLKVVHLVRDPRPMIASRVIALTRTRVTWLSDSIREFLCLYCKSNWENMVLGTQNPRIKDRYMFLRYEDAALDPVAAARRMHQFLGHSRVPESVLKWIDVNTKSAKPGRPLYSTARNSSKAYRAWRDGFPFDTAKAIEGTGQCAGMMARMGYIPLVDEKHLRNSSLSLLTSIPSGNDDKNYDWMWDL